MSRHNLKINVLLLNLHQVQEDLEVVFLDRNKLEAKAAELEDLKEKADLTLQQSRVKFSFKSRLCIFSRLKLS
jgi:ElaB/YqjD/DUF883 family membrane-anchored ribosome-binding protein